jgi:hypothetical protein
MTTHLRISSFADAASQTAMHCWKELTPQPMSEPNHSNDRPVATPWISRFFWLAGIYGVIVVVPLYFLEHHVGEKYPPPITHAEFLYAFAGVGLAWQIAFFVIATDPARFRLIMIPSALEKFSFAGAIAVLFAQGRVPPPLCAFAAIDLALGILFLIAFARLKTE